MGFDLLPIPPFLAPNHVNVHEYAITNFTHFSCLSSRDPELQMGETQLIVQ